MLERTGGRKKKIKSAILAPEILVFWGMWKEKLPDIQIHTVWIHPSLSKADLPHHELLKGWLKPMITGKDLEISQARPTV